MRIEIIFKDNADLERVAKYVSNLPDFKLYNDVIDDIRW